MSLFPEPFGAETNPNYSSNFMSNRTAGLKVPVPLSSADDSNPITLMMRQPSFAVLGGRFQTKAGDEIIAEGSNSISQRRELSSLQNAGEQQTNVHHVDNQQNLSLADNQNMSDGSNPRVVFDLSSKSLPFAASKELSHSCMYRNFSAKKMEITLSSDPMDPELECEEDSMPLMLGDNRTNNLLCFSSSNNQNLLSNNTNQNYRPKDRATQIMQKLQQINASRWESIGYVPSPLKFLASRAKVLDA